MKKNKLLTLTTSLLLFAAGSLSAASLNFVGQDVGAPALKGSAVASGGNITITGGGNDIWGSADNFYFYYAWAQGQQWDAYVKVKSLIGPDAWTKAELMVRVSDSVLGPRAGDQFIAAMTTQAPNSPTVGAPTDRIRGQGRTIYGGGADEFGPDVSAQITPNYDYSANGGSTWLRVIRNGAVFTLLSATNSATFAGANWITNGVIDTANSILGASSTKFTSAFPNLVAVGIAVTAHNDGDPTGGIATVSDLTATFPPVTAPTQIGATVQPANATNYAGSTATFRFTTTNNASPNVVIWPAYVSYQWYKNGTAIPGATATVYSPLLAAADDGAQYYARATIAAPYNTSVQGLTSSTGTVKVLAPTVYVKGLKQEFFAGATREQVELGNTAAGTYSLVAAPDDNGGYGNNYVRRLSGYFIPPTTDTYRFFLAGDDDTDLFLSTDSNPANKKIIAQETGWSGYRSWLTAGNAGAEATKRSDTWYDTNSMPAWTEATPLTAGQRYYIEAVLHQGGGGDNFGITYQTKTMMDAPNWGEVFTNGVASLMHATNNNIALMTGPTTSLEWVTQPINLSVYEGDPATFTVSAKTDNELSPMYQWYRDGTAVAGATKNSYTISPAALTDNNTQVHVVVRTAVENFSLTSSVVKLTVSQAILEKGFAKVEWWPGAVRADVLNGLVGTPAYTFAAPAFESAINNEAGSDYANRISGFVIPATTAAYDFFVNSDDDSDLFLSTNDKPATKRLIARETSWSNARQWTAGNSDAAMKRSDTFTDPATGTQPYAAGITLNANTKYYLEVVHHEGGGGDNLGVTWKKHTDPDPALNSASTLTGNVIAMFAPRSSYVAFTAQPQNTTVDPLGLATFTAPAVTDSVIPVGDLTTPKTNNFIIYQWAKNGVDIPGATAPTLTYGPVLPSESGAVFTTKIRALGYADAAGNPIWSNSAPATLTVQVAVFEPGLAKVEYWQGGTRLPVEQGTAGAPSWVTYIQQWDQGNWGDAVNNYAKRYSGYFIPPATDKYAFFINADDDADLFLSTDSNPANKRLIAQETQWGNGSLQWLATSSVQEQRKTDTFSPDGGTTYPFQEGIQMTAGQKYYMEGVVHEGGGGDYLQVLWTNQANIFDVVNGMPVNMTGSVIGTYVPQISYVAFTKQPANTTAESLMSATFSAAGISDSTISLSPNGRETLDNKPMLYQWYRGGVAIPGATKSTYTIAEVLPADNNAQFMVKIRALGYGDTTSLWWSNSQTATLTVQSKAPTVTSARFYTDPNGPAPVNYVDIGFNKRMDPATLGSLANYTATGGLTITGVTVSPDGRAVKLTVTGTPAASASVTVKAGKDATGTDLVANTVVNVQTLGLTFKDIGLPADPTIPREADPAFPSVLFVEGPNEFVVKAQGSDIWNNADGFNFLYEQKTGDFDVVVRQKGISHTSNWAKGGLMVRESTAPGSRNWNIVNTPLASDGIMAPDNSGLGTSAIEANFRGATDGATAGWDSNRGFHSAYPNAWLRMKRAGNVLTAYYSTDGQNWTQAAAQTVADLPANMLVGMATTAHNNDPAGTPPESQVYWNTVPYADWNSNYQPVTARPTLSYSISGNQMTISWLPAVGTLQQSSTLTGGSWTTVPSTGGSATVQIGAGNAFFRVMP